MDNPTRKQKKHLEKHVVKNKPNKNPFQPYWRVYDIHAGLKRGQLIQGAVRVNPKNFEEAYVPHPDGDSDVLICGLSDRNRALNGDIVAVLLYEQDEWNINKDNLESYEDEVSKQKPNYEHGISLEDKIESLAMAPSMHNPCQSKYTESPLITTGQLECKNCTGNQLECLNHLDIHPNCTSNNKEYDFNSANCHGDKEPCACGQPKEFKSSRSLMKHKSEKKHRKTEEIKQIYETGLQQFDQRNEASATNSPDQRNEGSATNSSDQSNVANVPRKALGQSNVRPSAKAKYTSVKALLKTKECSALAQGLFSGGIERDRKLSMRLLQRTGMVIGIIERKHSCACAGYLKPVRDNNPNRALFSPTDSRVPRLFIDMKNCPKAQQCLIQLEPNLGAWGDTSKVSSTLMQASRGQVYGVKVHGFRERPDDFATTLFIAYITEWPESSTYAFGKLARSLGEAGEIEPETEAILIENKVDFSDFSEEVLACLPQTLPWRIPQEEYAKRRDLTDKCIFTIDPKTARDLDDAVSCEHLGDGLYEVGVHIADVSYFVTENTELDGEAAARATSVYLVQKVVPMLPRLLCEELCSLNPNTPRLTFSVIWTLSDKGEVIDEWFGRSIIRSCVKFGYDHAQGFIDKPDKCWTKEELPPITNGFTINDVRQRVLSLDMIAKNLRQQRYDSGALRLDQVKLQYTLDSETGLPNGYTVYSAKDSNKLIEEFMLMANMAVGHKIKDAFPRKALLRRHPYPQTKMLDDLDGLCKKMEVPINTSSAGALQRSLAMYYGDDSCSLGRLQVLVSLVSKPMQLAQYFCTGIMADEEFYHHYALNVPIYTHFTSPIRRYPDVIVHRLLSAAIESDVELAMSVGEMEKQAEYCNDKKSYAKRVSDLSLELYFAIFVKEAGPLEEDAMVMAVLDRSFDIFILKLGVIKRVYCDKLSIISTNFRKQHGVPILTLIWSGPKENGPSCSQEIKIFTLVEAVLMADPAPLKWSAIIKPPPLAAADHDTPEDGGDLDKLKAVTNTEHQNDQLS